MVFFPVDTPPVVKMGSCEPVACRRAPANEARSSRKMPRSLTSQANRAATAISMKWLESNNWVAPRKPPGETISSPVEKTATRIRRRTSICVSPNAKHNILRSHPPACRQSRYACGKVLSHHRTDIGACLQTRREDYVATGVETDVLLHEYRVGANRHRRASKNANGAPRRQGLDCSGPCLNPPRHM